MHIAQNLAYNQYKVVIIGSHCFGVRIFLKEKKLSFVQTDFKKINLNP